MAVTEDDVKTQGDLVRKLKGEKADKATITAAVQKLISMKNELAAATGGAPVATGKQTKAQKKAAKAAAANKPTPDQKAENAAAPAAGLEALIEAQAGVVRQLKADKADKETINAAVQKLLALKAEAGITGKPSKKEKKAAKEKAPAAAPKEKKWEKNQTNNKKPKAAPAKAAAAAVTEYRTTTSDVAWDPLVPVGHTSFSWEDDGLGPEEPATATAAAAAASPAAARKADKPLLGAGCKAPAATEPDAASTAKLLGNGPTPNFAALWQGKGGAKMAFKCPLMSMKGDMLVWTAKAGVLECSEADQSSFFQEVDAAIKTKAVKVSQGVHDKYVSYCTSKGLPVGCISKGKNLYSSAMALLHGINCAPDKAAAIDELRTAVSDGCAEAMSLLGYCYQLGDGVGENPKLAAELYLAAARKGDAHGMVRLGRLYSTGVDGVLDKDATKAQSLISHGLSLLQKVYESATATRADKSRALSLLHSQHSQM